MSTSGPQKFKEQGFLVVPDVLGDSQCGFLGHHIQALEKESAGSRTLLEQSWCVDLALQLRTDLQIRDCFRKTPRQYSAHSLISHLKRIG